MLQGKFGGEGFSDMIEDNVEEHTEECRETLINKELEDLLKSSKDDGDGDDHDAEDLEEVEPSIWTVEKFAAVSQV